MVAPERILRAARGPLAGAGAQLLLLLALDRSVGLGTVGWAVGLASGLVLDSLLARALWRDPSARITPATWFTFTRASLAVGVAALAAERDVPVATFVTLASIALALDLVDGWVARRTETSALGARMDGEVDAFLLLALSVEVAGSLGPWVLAIGLARYVFLAAGWPFPWMRARLPRRDWRKVVTAAQGIALTLAAAQIAPPVVNQVVVAAALVLLAESFGRDTWWLWRRRHATSPRVATRHPVRATTLTVAAVVVVWVALVAPTKPWLVTPGAFARLPLDGVVVVLLAVVLPVRLGRIVPWVFGPILGLLVVLKLLDMGFFLAFDRPFNPIDDWSFLSFGVESARNTFGGTVANLTVAGGVLVVILALLVPTLALLQLTQVAVSHRRQALQVGATLTAVWIVSWAVGAQVSANASGADLAVREVHVVQSDIRDHARFKKQLKNDRFHDAAGDSLLAGLRGKDVLLVFVESYGRLAVTGSPFSPSVDAVLNAGTKQLAAAGFAARSGWITSSTFGGGSWWAHASLQSGTWINSQGRYNELVRSSRVTLASAFARAGWLTVAMDPSNDRAWPEGTSFYRYAKIYDRRNVGYRGPTYGFSSMSDEYTLLAMQRLELSKPNRRAIFSEIDTTSSHTPWTRIPSFIPWNEVGDGSIFNRLPVNRRGLTDTKQGYSASIKYSLRTLFSFVQHYANKNLVLIVLGDHQPSRVDGGRPGHDVPISIVAQDPTVLDRIAGWGWADGMTPAASSPVWPMNAFRNRFLDAFGS